MNCHTIQVYQSFLHAFDTEKDQQFGIALLYIKIKLLGASIFTFYKNEGNIRIILSDL